MGLFIVIAATILIVLAIGFVWYRHRNLHYNEALIRQAAQAGFKQKQATLPDGSVITYGEGPDGGPALLLIHGQAVAWEDYSKVLPELAKSFHVYAVDCFGHGESSHEPSLYSCRANGEALVWLIRNVIGEACYVSGHSSGGILATWLAANSPELVAGLVLEDPPLFSVTPEEIQEGRGAFAWYDMYTVTHQFVNQQADNDFTLFYLRHSYLLTLFGGLKDKLVRSAEKFRQTHPGKPIQIAWFPHAWLRILLFMDWYDPRFGNAFYDGTWMREVDQEQMLARISCPVIYLKANTVYGKDGVLYAANKDRDAEKVVQLIPHCETIRVKSGHNIHFERPAVFLSACRKLLSASPQGAGAGV